MSVNSEPQPKPQTRFPEIPQTVGTPKRLSNTSIIKKLALAGAGIATIFGIVKSTDADTVDVAQGAADVAASHINRGVQEHRKALDKAVDRNFPPPPKTTPTPQK